VSLATANGGSCRHRETLVT